MEKGNKKRRKKHEKKLQLRTSILIMMKFKANGVACQNVKSSVPSITLSMVI